MVLDRNSKLVRFSYYLYPRRYYDILEYRADGTVVRATGGRSKVPASGSLCAFFWRTFVFMPAGGLVMAFGLGSFVYGILTLLMRTPILVASLCGLLVWGVVTLEDYLSKRPVKHRQYKPPFWERPGPQAFFQGFKTIKGKVCPVIEFR